MASIFSRSCSNSVCVHPFQVDHNPSISINSLSISSFYEMVLWLTETKWNIRFLALWHRISRQWHIYFSNPANDNLQCFHSLETSCCVLSCFWILTIWGTVNRLQPFDASYIKPSYLFISSWCSIIRLKYLSKDSRFPISERIPIEKCKTLPKFNSTLRFRLTILPSSQKVAFTLINLSGCVPLKKSSLDSVPFCKILKKLNTPTTIRAQRISKTSGAVNSS